MHSHVRNLVRAAVMSAAAILLMTPIFEIPVPFLPPWLKFDPSTIPVLLSGFAMGPWWGLATQAVKSLVHWPMGTTGGVGEIADFFVGAAMMLPAALIYRKKRTRSRALAGMSLGVACMVAVGVLVNNFIMLPLFFPGGNAAAGIAGAMGESSMIRDVGTYLLYAVVPFNLMKGVLICLVTFILYRFLRPILHDPRS